VSDLVTVLELAVQHALERTVRGWWVSDEIVRKYCTIPSLGYVGARPLNWDVRSLRLRNQIIGAAFLPALSPPIEVSWRTNAAHV
jgi:hypothetical protein